MTDDRWSTTVIKSRDVVSDNTQQHSTDTGSQRATEAPDKTLHQQQAELLIPSRADACFHVVYAGFTPRTILPTRQTRQSSSLLLSNLASLEELWRRFPAPSRQERRPVWSSAAVAHLPRRLMCCSFKVVDGGYLSHCCLRVASDQSAHSPLTPGNNEVLSLRELLLSRHFPLSAKPRERPSRPAVSETLRQARPSFTNDVSHPPAIYYMPKYKADWGYLH